MQDLRTDISATSLLDPVSRRTALFSFTAGYALALTAEAQAASPITTPDNGLTVGQVKLFAPDGFALPAYMARPTGDGPFPMIVVVNEIFGIHAYIMDVCKRLAQAGYVALAPDYFRRAGDPTTLEDFGAILALVGQATHQQVMGDTQTALDWARAQPFVDSNRIGITGFCWGGTVVWMALAELEGFKAGVAWYGRLVARDDATEVRAYPLDSAAKLKGPVLGLYAENDGGIALSTVSSMSSALAAATDNTASLASRIDIFPGTEHGFHADYRRQYNAEAATKGWQQMLNWFATHGVPHDTAAPLILE